VIIKKSAARKLPVILTDDSDFLTRKTGVAFGSVTVKYAKEGDTSLSTFTLDASKWIELGNGIYLIAFTASELDNVGSFIYNVEVSGSLEYSGWVDIQENLNDDLKSKLDSMGTKIDSIKTTVEGISVENFNMGAR